jgi:hypothetical protein
MIQGVCEPRVLILGIPVNRRFLFHVNEDYQDVIRKDPEFKHHIPTHWERQATVRKGFGPSEETRFKITMSGSYSQSSVLEFPHLVS